MTHPVSTPVGSMVEIDTGAGYEEVVGANDIKADDGENATIQTAGVNSAVDYQAAVGVSDPGMCSFSYYEDVTDATHQWIQDKALAGGANVPVRVTLVGGKIKNGTGTLTSHKEGIAKKDAAKVEVEIKLNGLWAVTHPD